MGGFEPGRRRPPGAARRRAFPLSLVVILSPACGDRSQHPDAVAFGEEARAVTAPQERLEVPPPPFSPGIYPCSNCHGMLPSNPERRELTAFHADIVLRHDEEHRWCLDCHGAEDRDQLHLASGAPVPFDESYRLCGQCHGEKYRSWRAGVHGRRTGEWSGHKTYLLCAHCHDPHQPRFPPLEPDPPPVPPARTLRGGPRP